MSLGLEEWGPWALSVTSVPGVVFLRWKRRAGWLCSAAANVCYATYNAATSQWGFVPVNVAFLLLSLSNHRAWGQGAEAEGGSGTR